MRTKLSMNEDMPLVKSVNNNDATAMCCVLLTAAFFICLDASAFLIGCIDIDTECNVYLSLRASSLLISGVMINTLFSVIVISLSCMKRDHDSVMHIVNGLYCLIIFIMTCIGFSIYDDMETDCRDTSLGQILVVWTVIHFLCNLCHSITICCMCFPSFDGLMSKQ